MSTPYRSNHIDSNPGLSRYTFMAGRFTFIDALKLHSSIPPVYGVKITNKQNSSSFSCTSLNTSGKNANITPCRGTLGEYQYFIKLGAGFDYGCYFTHYIAWDN